MSLPIVFRPIAREEFDEATDWYDQRRAGLGAEFVENVNQTLHRITTTPLIHAVHHENVRRAPVAKFPYSILYRPEPDQILVIGVIHHRRNPANWERRT
jgi:plasmid stabilization system protein ParE